VHNPFLLIIQSKIKLIEALKPLLVPRAPMSSRNSFSRSARLRSCSYCFYSR